MTRTKKFIWLWNKFTDFRSRWILITEYIAGGSPDARFELEMRLGGSVCLR